MWHGTDYLTSFRGGRDANLINLNYEKEWDFCLRTKSFLIKTPFLVLSATLFTEIMPRASTRQG